MFIIRSLRQVVNNKINLRMSMSLLVTVDENISICGEIKNQNELASITSSYKSLIYLNPDSDGDNGCYGEGFNVIKEAMGVNAFQIPINVTQQPFTPFNSIKGYSLYLELQNTIDKCEKPLLLLCKSNRRAGAVFALYKGIQQKKSQQQLLEDSNSLLLSFPSTAPLFDWVKQIHAIGTSSPNMLRRQFFEHTSSTYTYLLVCSETMIGILIDPVLETVERDAQIIKEMGVTLKYFLNTHVHADHITGSGKLKNIFTNCLSIISEKSGASADIKVNDGDKIEFGKRFVTVLATPGHTEGCQSFVADDLSSVYTGDALLVRGCGRTDFQGGSASDLYDSVHSKIFTLPDQCIVYPAHCYKGNTQSTVGEEKRYNPRLSKGKDEFIEIMNSLTLPRPAKMDEAVPANMKCGIY